MTYEIKCPFLKTMLDAINDEQKERFYELLKKGNFKTEINIDAPGIFIAEDGYILNAMVKVEINK